MATTPNLRTQAEYYIRGLTEGFVTAAEVIAWADEVIVAAPKTEDWMLDISTAKVERHWTFARAWLRRELSHEEA